MNDNCVRKSKRKICKERRNKGNIKSRVQNCLDTEVDHIPVHISSIQVNFNLIVILALLFK